MKSYNLEYLYELEPELGQTAENYLNGVPDSDGTIVIVMEAYEQANNEWWLSDDPNIYGYFQLFEPRLLMDFSKFHEGVEALLGHPVFTHEFGRGYGLETLQDEAQQARENLGYF